VAVYRNVQLSFWTDNKVEDDFTPEDKYFYLYLLTNPQTNICGCYEVSWFQLTSQTGYNKETVIRLLDRFENIHKLIKFNKTNKEILILNWYKYNWSKSEKVLIGVESVAKHIKSKELREYIFSLINEIRANSEIGYTYPMETSVTDTDSVSVNNINSNNKNNTNKDKEELNKNFEIIYNNYPKKDGRARGFDLYKGWLKGRDVGGTKVKLTNKQMWLSIENYKHQLEENGTDKQYIKQFDTFMNKAILDYLPEEES